MSLIDNLNKKFSQKLESDERTFVGLVPTPESVMKISEAVKASGIKDGMDPNEYHLTLFYSKEGAIKDFYPTPNSNYLIEVEKVEKLGEYLVLTCRAPIVKARHKQIVDNYELEHSFPELIPHISVKYNPVDGDEKKLAFTGIIGTVLEVTGEYIELRT